jgi:hypothetical protein
MLRYLKPVFFFSFFLFSSLLAFPQQSGIAFNEDNKKPGIKDSLFIRDYSELLMFGIYTSAPYMNMNMLPVPDSLGSYGSNFKGNYSGTFGFNFGYKVLGVSFGFKLPADPGSIDSLGKSAYSVLGIKIRKKALTLSFDARKYKGFYDASTRNFNTSLPANAPFIIRPDLGVLSYSGTAIWNFAWKRYSFSAPLTYCDRQVKTRVGFLLKTDLSYLNIYADSALVSKSQGSAFPEFSHVKSIDALVFKTGPGLGMNLVFFKRMYFSLNLFLMNNTLIYRYNSEAGNQSGWRGNTNYFLEGGAGFGYSAKHFYVGIRAGGENNVVRLSGTKIQTSFGTVCFDMGIRLKAPKMLNRIWQKTATRYLGL